MIFDDNLINLMGIQSGPVAFLGFKDFKILFISKTSALGNLKTSVFKKCF